jgi:hypothetical protein
MKGPCGLSLKDFPHLRGTWMVSPLWGGSVHESAARKCLANDLLQCLQVKSDFVAGGHLFFYNRSLFLGGLFYCDFNLQLWHPDFPSCILTAFPLTWWCVIGVQVSVTYTPLTSAGADAIAWGAAWGLYWRDAVFFILFLNAHCWLSEDDGWPDDEWWLRLSGVSGWWFDYTVSHFTHESIKIPCPFFLRKETARTKWFRKETVEIQELWVLSHTPPRYLEAPNQRNHPPTPTNTHTNALTNSPADKTTNDP